MMKVKKIAVTGLTFVIAMSIVYLIFSDLLGSKNDSEDISSEDNFKQLINTENSLLMFYSDPNENLDELWKDLSKTVKKDYEAVNVAKFDCSVYRPICVGVGITKYPSIVWMKNGKIYQRYTQSFDEESLKTFVFQIMSSNDPDEFSLDDGSVNNNRIDEDDEDQVNDDISVEVPDFDKGSNNNDELANRNFDHDRDDNSDQADQADSNMNHQVPVQKGANLPESDDKFVVIDDSQADIDSSIVLDNKSAKVEEKSVIVDDSQADNGFVVLPNDKPAKMNEKSVLVDDSQADNGFVVLPNDKPAKVEEKSVIVDDSQVDNGFAVLPDDKPAKINEKSVLVDESHEPDNKDSAKVSDSKLPSIALKKPLVIEKTLEIPSIAAPSIAVQSNKTALKVPGQIGSPIEKAVLVQPVIKVAVKNATSSEEDNLLGQQGAKPVLLIGDDGSSDESGESKSESDESKGSDSDEADSKSVDIDKLLIEAPKSKEVEKPNDDDDNDSSPELEPIKSLDVSEDSDSQDKSNSSETSSEENGKPKLLDIAGMIKDAPDENFLQLTARNFNKKLNQDGVTMVLMHADWCETCDEIRKIMKKIAYKHRKDPKVSLGEIDCINKKNEAFCIAQQMQGVPTVNVYRNGELILNNLVGYSYIEIEDCLFSHLTDAGILKWKKRNSNRADKKIDTKKVPMAITGTAKKIPL